jgi:SAM-dependent methyltransferase
VGGTGRVTGLDNDVQLLEKARDQLSRDGAELYQFIAGDVLDQACNPVDRFDLVFARLLLLHLSDPIPTLSRLWNWVRPGGVLLIMDYDLTGMRSEPQHPTIERVLRLITAALRRAERDIEIGSRMPALFVAAGTGMPDGCEVNGLIIPGLPSTSMLHDVVISLQPIVIQQGIADAAALRRIDRELATSALDHHFLRWPDLIATWKMKAL